MADNATLTHGAVHTWATSESAGVHTLKVKPAANSGVDIGDVDVTSIVPGTGATNLGKAEDAGHTSGDVGVMALGVRQDGFTPVATTTGDYSPVLLDANGQVKVLSGFPDIVVTVQPTLDTNAYSSGDLLFDSASIANAVRANGGTCILQTVTILDDADLGVAFTLVFANAATDFGALNSAPDPDDAEAATVLGYVAVADTDYIDLGASKLACIKNIGLLLQADAATTTIWVAGINGTSTPTFAADDLHIKFGLLRG